MLYANDGAWWDCSGPKNGEFAGEKWSSHSGSLSINDNKTEFAERHGLRLVDGMPAGEGFSFDLGVIHYGDNSGFQAVNLALQFGCEEIWLLGFDMRDKGPTDPKPHFFGVHPVGCRKGRTISSWIANFNKAAERLPPGIRIVNATPGSALDCFERGTL